MNLKNIEWTFDCGTWAASVMGLQLAVVQDKDGSFMATCSGGGRPEIQKGFESPIEAREYCMDTLLKREYHKYFSEESQREDDVLDGIGEWFNRVAPEPTIRQTRVQLGCHLEEVAEMLRLIPDTQTAATIVNDYANALKAGDLEVAFTSSTNMTELLDSICDQMVTLVGIAHMLDFDLRSALEVVNASNWSKFEHGKPVYDENGKVKKGKDYRPPRLEAFV